MNWKITASCTSTYYSNDIDQVLKRFCQKQEELRSQGCNINQLQRLSYKGHKSCKYQWTRKSPLHAHLHIIVMTLTKFWKDTVRKVGVAFTRNGCTDEQTEKMTPIYDSLRRRIKIVEIGFYHQPINSWLFCTSIAHTKFLLGNWQIFPQGYSIDEFSNKF